MKLLVVTDSHGNSTALGRIIREEAPFEYLIHCGDGLDDLARVEMPPLASLVAVQGNIDRARGVRGEERANLVIMGRRILIVHGDRQGAHNDLLGLLDEAKTGGFDMVLFGHTHKKYLAEGTPLLFNPGAAQGGLYGVVVMGERIEVFAKRLSGLVS